MPAVFVHGVPETPAVWEPLIAALARPDCVTVQLPGFGCPLPDGFEPTKERYATWLDSELDAIDGPIDLVTHDWGAILAIRVLGGGRTDVRSWVTDGADLPDDFRWHDTARIWQTPGEGEAWVEAVLEASADERAELLTAVGVPAAGTGEMAATFDATMAAAILTLYRSAVDIGPEWGPALDDIKIPVLAIDAPEDGFRAAGAQRALARRVGARVVTLAGQGHWWMLGDPQASAVAIADFWAGLDS